MAALTEIPLGAGTVEAAAALTRFRFVKPDGTVPSAGDYCAGVVPMDCDAGTQAPFVFSGIVIVEAGAAVAAGAEVQVDANGKAITKAAGQLVGRALTAASVDTDLILVKL